MTIPTRVLKLMGVDPLCLKLREWRRGEGIRQRELAVMMGVHYSVICRWERGLVRLTPNARARVEKFLKAPPPRPWV